MRTFPEMVGVRFSCLQKKLWPIAFHKPAADMEVCCCTGEAKLSVMLALSYVVMLKWFYL